MKAKIILTIVSISLIISCEKGIDEVSNWKDVSIDTEELITGIEFSSDNTGFAYTTADINAAIPNIMGGYIEVEEQIVNTDNSTIAFGYTKFLRQDSTSHYLYKTIDGGHNWQSIATPFTTIKDLKALNDDVVFVVAEEGIYKSANGGVYWQKVFENLVVLEKYFYGNVFDHIDIIDENNFCLRAWDLRVSMGLNVKVNTTTKEWSIISGRGSESGLMKRFTKVIPSEITNTFFAIGHPGELYKSVDGGSNWTQIVSNQHFMDVELADNSILYKLYSSTLAKSSDGGVNWVNQIYLYDLAHASYSQELIVFDEQNIICTGDETILKSTDGGNTFNHIEYNLGYPKQFQFPSLNTGYALLDGGSIYRYENLNE